MAEAARAAGVTVATDLNYRARLWPPEEARPVLERLARAAEIVITTADDLRALFGMSGEPEALAAAARERFGCRTLALTLGGEGAVSADDGARRRCAVFPSHPRGPHRRGRRLYRRLPLRVAGRAAGAGARLRAGHGGAEAQRGRRHPGHHHRRGRARRGPRRAGDPEMTRSRMALSFGERLDLDLLVGEDPPPLTGAMVVPQDVHLILGETGPIEDTRETPEQVLAAPGPLAPAPAGIGGGGRAAGRVAAPPAGDRLRLRSLAARARDPRLRGPHRRLRGSAHARHPFAWPSSPSAPRTRGSTPIAS